MKAVIQRVRNASVSVEGKVTGAIDRGLLVYLGVASSDTEKDSEWMAEKTANLRVFNDSQNKMNLSIKDLAKNIENNSLAEKSKTGVLVVSQFTLLGDASKGRRPYYGEAAEPVKANTLYEYFIKKIKEDGLLCESGVFQAHMDVSCINDGPVTILLDSQAK